MDSENTTIVAMGDEGCVRIMPCKCCSNTEIAIITPACLLRLASVEPDELVSLAEALLEVAENQSSKEDFSEWN
jgi:hypothetical protein